MTTILSYLIIGHLVGDFLLQPSRLIAWKERSLLGTFIHCMIHWATYLFLLMPVILSFSNNIFLLTGIIVLAHFIIDTSKLHYDKHHKNRVRPFLIDQLLHLITIFTVFLLFRPLEFTFPDHFGYTIYTSFTLQSFLILTMLFALAYPIYQYQKQLEQKKTTKLKLSPSSMLTRFLVIFSIYFIWLNLFA